VLLEREKKVEHRGTAITGIDGLFLNSNTLPVLNFDTPFMSECLIDSAITYIFIEVGKKT
jgi:hypothetical protein